MKRKQLTYQIILFVAFLILLESNIESPNFVGFCYVVVDKDVECKEKVIENVFIIQVLIEEKEYQPNDGVDTIEDEGMNKIESPSMLAIVKETILRI